ncbi:MAG: ArsR/SmtB family transcription factor [Steroidobacteraceae bacterium]
MLDFLRQAPRTTGELCEQFRELDRCTVMQHLGVLERAELVIARSEGRQRWNVLNVMPIKEIHDRWIGAYAAQAVGLLARLKQELESPETARRARRRA